MLKQRSDQRFLSLLGLVDIAVTCLCWVGAYYLRWGTNIIDPVDEIPPFSWCLRCLPSVAVAALLSYQLTGLYQIGRRLPLSHELFRAGKATGLMLVLLLASTFYLPTPYQSRLVSVLFGLTTLISLVLVRRISGMYFRLRRRRGTVDGKALIVGTGRIARNIEQALRTNNWLGLLPMGYVDDPRFASPHRPTQLVGTIEDLPNLIEQHEIDYVFIALPLERYAETKQIFRTLKNTLVEVRLVPDIPQLAVASVQVSEVEGLPVLNLRHSPHRFTDVMLKRAMDIVLSAIGLLLLSPVMAAVALVIKLTDWGPIFYSQERMGLNGHRFNMYKFRSMTVNAEAGTGPVWAREGDARRTWFGSFIRRTSLDELPQLYNVLVGDMSLVGPRPERPYFINSFRESIPRYMLRHAVKAGITGWAQVNGWRGNTSLRKRVQYDLYYIANWSIWLDVRILFLTVLRVVSDRNAY